MHTLALPKETGKEKEKEMKEEGMSAAVLELLLFRQTSTQLTDMC